jgi:predicted nuclease of predicted toxin-antitoxin system
MIKILIDMNLPPKWVDVFDAEGWKAVHWSQIGDFCATDQVIMKWALDHDFILFTHDLDFGSILAATSAAAPSVIQVRTQNVMPKSVGTMVVDAVRKFKDKLGDGALISIDHKKARARVLPLRE